MPETQAKKLRWQEKMDAPPAGFNQVVRTYVRVVEGDGPIPKGCVETDVPAHDWKLQEEK